MDDKIQIQVLFTIIDPDSGLNFTDALYYAPEVYAITSEADIEAAKQERYDNWKNVINTSLSEIPVEDQIASIDDQIDQLTQQKDQLQAEAS